jgi:hypothetical protein
MGWWSILRGVAPPQTSRAPSDPPAVDAPRGLRPASVSDGIDAARTDASRPEPRPARPSRFSMSALGASMVGKVGIGLATTAIVLGSMLGQPGALPRNGGVPLDRVEVVQPRGTLVREVDSALTQVVRQVLPDASRDSVLQQIEHVRLGVRVDDGVTAPDGLGLGLEAGARISVTLDRGGVTLRSSPGASWGVDWRPDPTIHSIRYDFSTASFQARASGLGPDGLYSDAVDDRLATDVQPLLPAAMRQAGYDPWKDPALGDNLQRLVDAFVQPGAASTVTPPKVSAPEVSISYRVPAAKTIALPDGQGSALLEAGTLVDVSVATRGGLDGLRLGTLDVRFGQHPLRVVQGDDPESLLRRVEINGITLSPGGQITLDYELGAEQAVDGVRALGLLLAIAAEPGLAHRVGTSTLTPTRLEAFRGMVQGVVDGELEPQLLSLVKQNDRAVPGFSMVDFLGVRR